MSKVNLANPITGHANELAAFLAKDADIHTKFEFKRRVLRIYVDDAAKAEALACVLKKRIELGKLYLDIAIYPPNGDKGYGKKLDVKLNDLEKGEPEVLKALWKTAFKGNKNFVRVLQAKDRTGTIWTFALFNRVAVQWLNDDIQNPELTTSALPETVVKTFAAEHLGVQVSTDVLRLWNADHRKQRGRTAPNRA